MRALLLAAGRGQRMRPLSDTVAKPLLPAGGRRLIEWQIDAMVRAGIADIVINTAHLAAQIEEALGDGTHYGARLRYSREGVHAGDALETLGGIVKALPLLGAEPFVIASSDIVTDFDYAQLAAPAAAIARGDLDAHLVLVENPPYHPQGDMGMMPGMMPGMIPGTVPGEGATFAPGPAAGTALVTRAAPLLTYANIGVLAPRLFAGLAPERARLFPWLYASVDRGRVGAQRWQGRWWNVGTPQDLAMVDKILR
jgi:MurNAc alpha-1-phosphate uridylyltransferase